MTNNDPSAEKPTDQWVTGDEPMTGPQRSYLNTLAREAGEEVPDDLTKAQASEMIERLQHVTGRGNEQHESLGQRLEEEGVVDQQAAILDEIDENRATS
ncbi:MAG TPA: DUF3072 domain-containing protein [Ilumatobacteraceae bacterium]|jgi:hypothetical protein